MKNKNIVKLFFASMLFIMACKAYVEEKIQIDSLSTGVSTLNTIFNNNEIKASTIFEKYKSLN
ncbi:fibronectin-binding protein RevA [Borreliella burgdorferi]|uniref:fibronectin-binding protein RevA n=1 Tax=Borreliella burgdorferi TaxID=139 RepID=UPI00017F3846|nr:fibronectin-binding protein RevA [Borreliella burgdorferi]ACN55494.1 hypothetical protein BBUWI9123_V0011 [Borreliella burgdorferi WI91-23]